MEVGIFMSHLRVQLLKFDRRDQLVDPLSEPGLHARHQVTVN
jgi:hypothetical protein